AIALSCRFVASLLSSSSTFLYSLAKHWLKKLLRRYSSLFQYWERDLNGSLSNERVRKVIELKNLWFLRQKN
ncbi:Hypothetical predicted protein, partial [Paramuricea clavata]